MQHLLSSRCNNNIYNISQIRWRLSDIPISPEDLEDKQLSDPAFRAKQRCKIFLGYTSNLISSGVRETLCYLVKNRMVSEWVASCLLQKSSRASFDPSLGSVGHVWKHCPPHFRCHGKVDVVVSTAGGIEEDFIKCLAPTYMGDFKLKGEALRKKGLNRIGNLICPNANYVLFENWLMPILDAMLEEQKTKVRREG